MYLYLDANQGRFAFFQASGDFAALEWHTIEKDASLPKLLGELLPAPLTGIVVEQGKGSFSQSREAVVFANMYSKATSAQTLSLSESPKEISALIDQLQGNGPQMLEPVYSGEPNISRAK